MYKSDEGWPRRSRAWHCLTIIRNEESGVDPNYCLIINMFTLFVMFTNPMLLLEASKGYWRFPCVDMPFIFFYFLNVIDCRSVQVSAFTLHATWCIEYIGLRACYVRNKVFWGANCSREKKVLRSKVFWGAKCSEEQSVPGSERWREA